MDFSGEMADEILKIFQVESEEIITRLNSSLLLLEKNPKDKDALLLLFRDAHTLKGASRMVGFTNVQTIAHKVEDILGLAKENKITIDSDSVKILYRTVDFLADIIQKSIEKGKEIYSEDISKYMTSLESVETKTEVAALGEEKMDFDSKLLSENATRINDLISQILFGLMSLELNKTQDSIEKLLSLSSELFDIFKELKLYEIKDLVEDVKAKLEFTCRLSSELTDSEIDELQQKIDKVIGHLIVLYELHHLNIIDFYSVAFEQASKEEKTAAQTIINVETDLQQETETYKADEKQLGQLEHLEKIQNLVLNLPQGTSSISEIQSAILNFNETCTNQDVKNITEKIIKILSFVSENELNLDDESLSVITQSTEHCLNIIENKADMSVQELFIQRLTIIQQVLEINQNKDDDKKFTTKSNCKLKNKINDFSKIYNTGDIKTLRVDSDKLDTLINQVNELTVTKIKAKKHIQELATVNKELEEWQRAATKAVSYLKYYDKKYFQSTNNETPISFFIKQLLNLFNDNNKKAQETSANISNLQRTIQEDDAKTNVIIENLSNMVKEVRVLPLATVFHLFGRMVRDIAQEKNKKIDLEIYGSETSTDKKIIEEIKAPLIHILRNSIDHGIETPEERIALGKNETGKIILSAKQHGNQVLIEIKDDGKGINIEKIKAKALQKGFLTQEEISTMSDEQITNVIFAPGFSTGEEITNLSGRGIGLDVVQSKIAQLNGRVKIISELNKGCCIQIELPTTMSTIKAFLVKSADQTFAIPMEAINTVMRKNNDEIIHNKDKKSILFKGKPITLNDLSEILNLQKTMTEQTKETVLILETGNKIMALAVDKLLGDQEILHKKLSAPLYKLKNISGITTLASGETCLILNIPEIMKTADKFKTSQIGAKTRSLLANNDYRILLVDDSITTRTMEKNILLKLGYSIEVATNPIEAFEIMKTMKFNLIISDIEMPEMSGLEFLEKIKADEMHAQIPVIMVSSLISEEYKRQAASLGAAKYIEKGAFEQDGFQESIKKILLKNSD